MFLYETVLGHISDIYGEAKLNYVKSLHEKNTSQQEIFDNLIEIYTS